MKYICVHDKDIHCTLSISMESRVVECYIKVNKKLNVYY